MRGLCGPLLVAAEELEVMDVLVLHSWRLANNGPDRGTCSTCSNTAGEE